MASTYRANQQVGKRLTKRYVDALPAPTLGQVFVRDSELKGFALRITANGAKSFVVEKRINGKVRRITLARYPELTVEQARLEAQKQLGAIATGYDPIRARQEERVKGITLHEAYKEFRQAKGHLTPKTLYVYHRTLEVAFGDWMNKALRDISKDMVARRFEQMGTERGHAYANLAMRTLRSVLNFAIARYDDADGNPILRDNPVLRLTRTNAWYPSKRRQTVIKPHQLPAWYAAVMRLRTETPTRAAEMVADYLRLLIFTGLRRTEAAQLKWVDIDLKDRTLLIRNTKNRVPLTLPLSDFLHDLLSERRAITVGDYVFPGEGHPGPLVEPRAGVQWVIQASGVSFILHDLRRTFITVAESLDIPMYAIKRLVNHKMSNDVTAGYIISDIARLRAPMQKITDYLKDTMGVVKEAKVLVLPVQHRKQS